MLNAIERMENEGDVPSRVDRSYIKNMPGSTQAQFRHACRWLGLVNADETPTDTLRQLVHQRDDRKELVGDLLRHYYPGPLTLPKNATQGQLEDEFREMGAGSAETLRKSVAFFLKACEYAAIDLSNQFKQPRAPRNNNGAAPRRARRKNGGVQQQRSDEPEYESARNEAPNIIRDLLTKLPAEGSTWQRSKVEQWLGIARLTFEMVYDLEGEYSDQLIPGQKSGGDGS